MNITLFGGTGRLGSHVMKQALDAGYFVRAFVRDSSKVLLRHSNLDLVEGQLEDNLKMAGAVRGADALISCLGGSLDEPPAEARSRIENILQAMQETSTQRILAVGNMGILQESEIRMVKDNPSFPKLYLNSAMVHLQTFEGLYASPTNWTLACPPSLTDDAFTGVYRTRKNFNPENGSSIGMADLADFLLKEALDIRFPKSRVGVAY